MLRVLALRVHWNRLARLDSFLGVTRNRIPLSGPIATPMMVVGRPRFDTELLVAEHLLTPRNRFHDISEVLGLAIGIVLGGNGCLLRRSGPKFLPERSR